MRSIGALALLICATRLACAQGAPYLRTLTVPPESVGTCLAMTPPRAGTPVAGMHGHHISIKTRAPAGDRDIMVFSDNRGRVRRLADRGSVSTGLGSTVAALAFADIDTGGRVRGNIMYDTPTMAVPPPGRGPMPDSAGWRRIREHAVRRHAQALLDAAQQEKAKDVATWLLRRCPR